MTKTTTKTDHFGNKVRREGVDFCWCGCKYWENDRCIDCGGTDAAGEVPDYVRYGLTVDGKGTV